MCSNKAMLPPQVRTLFTVRSYVQFHSKIAVCDVTENCIGICLLWNIRSVIVVPPVMLWMGFPLVIVSRLAPFIRY